MRVAVRTLKRRHAVPRLDLYEGTIMREVRYWRPRLRRLLTTDDLRSEAMLVALKCEKSFDPMREIEFSTYLTDALRKHFRRLIKRTLSRALLYTPEQQDTLREWASQHASYNPSRALDATLMLRRLRSMPEIYQQLAVALARHGELSAAARELHLYLPRARKMLDKMRVKLRG